MSRTLPLEVKIRLILHPQIGLVIGAGGKTIRGIEQDTGAEITQVISSVNAPGPMDEAAQPMGI